MKKLFAALTALMLMTGIFGAAYASEGDRTVIFRQEDTEEYYNLEACLEVNGKVAYVKSFGDETTVNMYDPDSGETEVYDISKPMRELYGWAEDSEIDVKNWLDGYRDGGADRRRPEEDDEDDEDDSDEKNEENSEYSNVNAWFVRNGEICLIVSKRIDTGRETKLEGGYIYRLVLKDGTEEEREIRVPEALADILGEVDNANRLAAKAAEGDREAVREYVETDPALAGLDRLYCMDVADALIMMHEDVLSKF